MAFFPFLSLSHLFDEMEGHLNIFVTYEPMQNFKTLQQSLLGELAMSPEERERERKRKNAIYSGHLRLCQQPRAAHALRSYQFFI